MASQTVQPHETARAGNGRSQWATDLKYRWPARYRSSWVALGLTLVLVVLVASAALNPASITLVTALAGVLAIAAVGQMLIIMLGAIDLSISAIISVSAGIAVHYGTEGSNAPLVLRLPSLVSVLLEPGERHSHLGPPTQRRDRDARHAGHDAGGHQPLDGCVAVRHGRGSAATPGPGTGLDPEGQRRVHRRHGRLRPHGGLPQQDPVRPADRGSGFEPPRGTRPRDAGDAGRARHLRPGRASLRYRRVCSSQATSVRRT